MLDHRIGFGMVKDTTSIGDDVDDWPAIHRRILDADILVIGTPIWLGVKSRACAMETLYVLSHIGYTIPPQADCGWIGESERRKSVKRALR